MGPLGGSCSSKQLLNACWEVQTSPPRPSRCCQSTPDLTCWMIQMRCTWAGRASAPSPPSAAWPLSAPPASSPAACCVTCGERAPQHAAWGCRGALEPRGARAFRGALALAPPPPLALPTRPTSTHLPHPHPPTHPTHPQAHPSPPRHGWQTRRWPPRGGESSPCRQERGGGLQGSTASVGGSV